MHKSQHSLPPLYFDQIYEAKSDPWDFATSPYEAAKYAATLAALPKARYHSAFEIGCSIGVLTAHLAARCDALLAVDVSQRALDQARQRCGSQPHVRFAHLRVPDAFPNQIFDLVLLSEVGYYWSWDDLARARRGIIKCLSQGGHVLLVHWTPTVDDYPLTGDEVHDFFLRHQDGDLQHLYGRHDACYRLDLFERR